MKTFLFASLFLISVNAYAAEVEKYAVEQPDVSIHIINYLVGSHDSLETIVHEGGYDGLPIVKLKDSDFPPNRSDRNFWKLNPVPIGKKIQVDMVKKAAAEAAETVKEGRKRAFYL